MNLDAADFAARPGIEAAFEARVSADTESSSTTRASASSAASEGVFHCPCVVAPTPGTVLASRRSPVRGGQGRPLADHCPVSLIGTRVGDASPKASSFCTDSGGHLSRCGSLLQTNRYRADTQRVTPPLWNCCAEDDSCVSPMAAERHISKTSLRQRRCAFSGLMVQGSSSAFGLVEC